MCLWQDLDGLHVEPAPRSAPPTSVVWGWRAWGDYLARVRLDGDTAFVAVHQAGGPDGIPAEPDNVVGPVPVAVPTLPWSPGDDRVAASQGRGPSAGDSGPGTAYEQIVVDGIGDGVGPITFLRPARPRRGGLPAG
jgi:hypothetical protein